jgi:dipeptidyl aminopeptidase/acylaminoacyl peptidase
LDQVRTPLMLVAGDHSAHNTAAAVDAFSGWELDEARKAYRCLSRLNKPAELRVYEGQAHGPLNWARSCQEDLARGMLQWFERWTKR